MITEAASISQVCGHITGAVIKMVPGSVRRADTGERDRGERERERQRKRDRQGETERERDRDLL